MVTNTFLVSGGDGYVVLTQGTGKIDTGFIDADVTAEYIRANSPMKPQVEGRIQQAAAASAPAPSQPAPPTPSAPADTTSDTAAPSSAPVSPPPAGAACCCPIRAATSCRLGCSLCWVLPQLVAASPCAEHIGAS